MKSGKEWSRIRTRWFRERKGITWGIRKEEA
jgi:hypothetical protein